MLRTLVLLLLLPACATTRGPAAQPTATATAAPSRPTGFKDRALRLDVIDERTDLEESAQLRRATQELLTERLRAAGAVLASDAKELLVVTIREFGSMHEGSTPLSCAGFGARLGEQSFLPGELRARHCASEGVGLGSDPATLTATSEDSVGRAVLGINRSVISVKDKPGLAKAYALALEELFNRLERRPRP